MTFDDFYRAIGKEKNLLFQFIEKYRNSEKAVFLFGAGFCGRVYMRLMQRYQMPVAGIIDNFKTSMGDIPVLRLEDAAKKYDLSQCLFIISAPSKYEEIKKQLLEVVQPEQVFNFPVTRYDNPANEPGSAREYLLTHKDDMRFIYDLLADDHSKDVLIKTTLGELTASFKYIRSVWSGDFYYPPDLITFCDNEIMVELGSNNGDTLRDFISRCPNFQKAYCFEPETICMESLREIAAHYDDRIKIIPKAAWNGKGKIGFVNMDGIMNSKVDVSGGNVCVETAAVDDEVSEKITYMKMDVEGAEMMALEGAKKQITQNKPRLAISVYHKKEDIIDIPKYILSLRPDYQLYLRHHSLDGCDTVLYAI